MEELPEYYTILFSAVEKAISALEKQNFGLTRDILIRAEQQAEAAFVDEETADRGTTQ